jgi:RNA polymerase sigma-54 factor
MRSRQRINVTQTQRLALNASLQASIRLLRTDAAGLTRYLEEQAAENPALVLARIEAAPNDWLPRWSGAFSVRRPVDDVIEAAAPSLIAHVMAGIDRIAPKDPNRRIALTLAEALEPSGWLGRDTGQISAELQVPVARVDAVLSALQRLEPAGLFARSLAECLLLQAVEVGAADAVLRAMLGHLDLLAAGDFRKLARLCDTTEDAVVARFRLIRSFDPKPGAQFCAEGAPVREPDLIARPDGAGWQITLNRSAIPSVQVAVDGPGDRTAARQVARLVDSRNSTLLRVGQEILRRQHGALTRGFVGLVPMTMADLADALDLHESTISRIVAGASVDTPRGTWWLRQLFSKRMGGQAAPDLSAAALRARLSAAVAAEDVARPLSDLALARLLSEGGAEIARRTVAKYRALLGIPPAHRRRDRQLPVGDRKGRGRG